MCELRPAFTDRAMASRRARRIHWTRNARNLSRLIFHSKPRRKQRAASFGCFDDKDHKTHYIEFKDVQQILQKTDAYIVGV